MINLLSVFIFKNRLRYIIQDKLFFTQRNMVSSIYILLLFKESVPMCREKYAL